MTTYALSVNDLKDIVEEYVRNNADSDKFDIENNHYLTDRIINMLSANYIINIKRLNPQAPDVLAPLKFKATKYRFDFKEIANQQIEPLSYHDKIRLTKLIEQGCQDVLNFSGFMTLTILSDVQSSDEWQQSNATQAWLTPAEHANAYRGILAQN